METTVIDENMVSGISVPMIQMDVSNVLVISLEPGITKDVTSMMVLVLVRDELLEKIVINVFLNIMVFLKIQKVVSLVTAILEGLRAINVISLLETVNAKNTSAVVVVMFLILLTTVLILIITYTKQKLFLQQMDRLSLVKVVE